MATGSMKGDDFMHSFIFSVWDNVMGPKILKIWPKSVLNLWTEESITRDEVDEIGVEASEEQSRVIKTEIQGNNELMIKTDDAVAKYIAIHTLTGHMSTRNKSHDCEAISDVCLSVPALKFISQTTTFYCPSLSYGAVNSDGSSEDLCMCSLSLVFHHEYENVFWNLHPLILYLLQQTTRKIKVGLFQDPVYYEKPVVGTWLSGIYSQIFITVMHKVQIPPQPLLTVKQTFLRSHLEWDVIVTAMLSTGSCCVVGKNEELINKIIDLLVFFLPNDTQRLCSRYTSDHFCSGLHIQGLLENAQGSRNINSSDILVNSFPLTILDLTQKGRVKFTGYIHEHYRSKQRQLRQQEYNIIENLDPNIPFTTESVLRPFGSSSRYVRWCLEQLDTHNIEHWSRIIVSFHRALACQANKLIKAYYIEHNQKNGSSVPVCNRLKRILQITEPDFWLLAAISEQMQPGFCQAFNTYRVL